MSRDQVVFSRSTITVGSAKNEFMRQIDLGDAELAHEFQALVSPSKIKLGPFCFSANASNELLFSALENAELSIDHKAAELFETVPQQFNLALEFSSQFPVLGVSLPTTSVQSDFSDPNPKNIRQEPVEAVGRRASAPQLQKQGGNLQTGLTKGLDVFDKPVTNPGAEIATAKPNEQSAYAGLGMVLGLQAGQTAYSSVALSSQHLVLRNVHVDTVTKNTAGKLTSIELSLEPAELGRISVRLEQSQDRLVLRVSAENPLAAELLAQDAGQLLRALSSQIGGIENTSIVILRDGQEFVTASNLASESLDSKKQRREDSGFNQQQSFDKDIDRSSNYGNPQNETTTAGILI